LEAERLVHGARNRNLIVELMPHYPVYVPLLPGDAQASMGQVHPESEMPFEILAKEGFAADEYIDIFDGGPILEASRHALNSFTQGLRLRVAEKAAGAQSPYGECTYLIAPIREAEFRVTLMRSSALEHGQSVQLSDEVMQALQVTPGDTVLCIPT